MGRFLTDAPAPTDQLDRDLALLYEHLAWAKLVGDDSEITDAIERVLRTMIEQIDSPTELQQHLLGRLNAGG